MKSLRLCWAVILLAGLVAAPAAAHGKTAVQQEPLVVWTFWESNDLVLFEGLVSVFEQKYPYIDVVIEQIPYDDLVTRLGIAVSAGKGPDVAFVEYNQMRGLAFQGMLKPIELNSDPQFLDEFTNDWASWCYKPEGTSRYLMGVPLVAESLSVFGYSPDVFNQFGVTPPFIWDELHILADQFNAQSIQPIMIWSRFEMLNWITNIALRTTSGQEIVDVHNEFVAQDYINTDVFADDFNNLISRFVNHDSAMAFVGSWIDRYLETTQGLIPGADYTFFSFPEINAAAGEPVTVVDMTLLSKFTHNSNAETFIEFMTIRETTQGELQPSDELAAYGFIVPNHLLDLAVYRDDNKRLIAEDLTNGPILPLPASAVIHLTSGLFPDPSDIRLQAGKSIDVYWGCVSELLQCRDDTRRCRTDDAACKTAESCYQHVNQVGCVSW